MNARHALLLCASACGAAATTGPKSAGGTRVDIAPVRDDMVVYTDGKSHYLALIEPNPERATPAELRLFYGDGKTFHAAAVSGAHADGLKFEIGFNDPRIPAVPAGSVTREEGKVKLSCYGTDVALQQVPAEEARALVAAATFYPNTTSWSPLALVKDGDRYLYVDSQKGEGERAYRVFEGKKGSMKQVELKGAKYVEASNEFRFVTAKGTLVATRDPEVKTGYALGLAWEGKKAEWQTLERAESWRLIFEGLGVYGEPRTPTPCDPMMP